MIDTTNKEKDVDMEEEAKEPKQMHKPSIDDGSELIKSEAFEIEKSEMSEQYDIDPFFGRTVSMDATNAFNKLTQRSGRSESIRNPILTSFWKMNDSTDRKSRIKPDHNYMKLEERGFTRHLLLEGKYEEALNYLLDTFPDTLKKDNRIKTSINCLQLVKILQSGKLEEAIQFGQESLIGMEQVSIPAIDNDGNYCEVTPVDFFSLIAFQDMETSEFSYLLND